MKRYLPKQYRRNKGFVSSYFLALLLYILSIVNICAANDAARLKTLKNLEVNQKYFVGEMAVIMDVKCRLLNEQLEDGSYTASGYAYDVVYENGAASITVYGEYPETIRLLFDMDEKRVMDYQTFRNGTQVYE